MISVAVPDVRPSGSVEPSPLHIFITGLTGVNTPDKGQVPFQMARRGTERERGGPSIINTITIIA